MKYHTVLINNCIYRQMFDVLLQAARCSNKWSLEAAKFRKTLTNSKVDSIILQKYLEHQKNSLKWMFGYFQPFPM